MKKFDRKRAAAGDFADEQESEKPDKPTGACHCHGCPLPGTMSTDTLGSGNWFCSVHFGAEPRHWDEITHRIRSRSAMFEITLELRRQLAAQPPWVTDEIAKSIRQHLRSDKRTAHYACDAADPPIETARQYLSGLLKILAAECKRDIDVAVSADAAAAVMKQKATSTARRLVEGVKEWLARMAA